MTREDRVQPGARYAVRLNCDGTVSTWRHHPAKGLPVDDAATALAVAVGRDARHAALRLMIAACSAELGAGEGPGNA